MQIAHVNLDLTSLRYLIPLSHRIHEFRPDIEQWFMLPRVSEKYNGLVSNENMKLCMSLLEETCPYLSKKDVPGAFDVVFQVETGSYYECRRRIAIQHGFDYMFVDRNTRASVDMYICSSSLTQDDLEKKGSSTIVPPIPVCMWESTASSIEGCRTALVFYPDWGDVKIANDVISNLETLGYIVYVKQRRKCQRISGRGIHVYDDVWFPSESIVLPSSVDIVVGFGSSAYVDLVPMGINYVNVDLHSSIKPWCDFLHPVAKNYTRVLDIKDVSTMISKALEKKDDIPRKHVVVAQLRAFILGLLEWSMQS